MSLVFQLLLIAGALIMLIFVLVNIHNSKLRIGDSLFWFGFALVLVIFAIFPSLANRLSDVIGVKSPENLIFLGVILVLVYREFRVTLRLSQVDIRLRSLVTKLAIDSDSKEEKD